MRLRLTSIITTIVLTLALTSMTLEARVNIVIGSNKDSESSGDEQSSDRRLSKPARERKDQELDEKRTPPSSPLKPGTPVSPEPRPPSAPSAIPTPDSSSVSEPTPSTDRRIIVRPWERELYKQQQAEKKADSEKSDKSPTASPTATKSADKTKTDKELSSQIDTDNSTQNIEPDAHSKDPSIITNPHRRF